MLICPVVSNSTTSPAIAFAFIPSSSCTPYKPCTQTLSATLSISTRPARGIHALEVILAHGPVAAVPVEALDALGGGLLARVEPLALALARRRNDGTTLATDLTDRPHHRREGGAGRWVDYPPVELLLGVVVPRVLALVSLGRHPVVRWCCGASAGDGGRCVVVRVVGGKRRSVPRLVW